MSLLAAEEVPRPPPPAGGRLLRLLGRHQAASLIATVLDFAAMVTSVELGRVSPVVGTAIGATCGAVVNFLINRHWTFDAAHRGLTPQAMRYVLVSGVSLGLQVLGEWLVNGVAGAHYVVARVIVAVITSLLWNFPMQRHYVFRA